MGELYGTGKVRALGEAGVLVFSSTWEEPFGLALIEAMLCGTPVAALRRGAIPELIDEGVTGISVDDPSELPGAISAALTLDRRLVRERALSHFAVSRMASRYLHLYERALADDQQALARLRG